MKLRSALNCHVWHGAGPTIQFWREHKNSPPDICVYARSPQEWPEASEGTLVTLWSIARMIWSSREWPETREGTWVSVWSIARSITAR
jgi:hypothetical protein